MLLSDFSDNVTPQLVHNLSDIFTTCKGNLQSGLMFSVSLQFVKKTDRFANRRNRYLLIFTIILTVNSNGYGTSAFYLPVA
jgi:hypothetical protein